MHEGGRPTRIDPETLHNPSESDLEGVVASTFSAHPHRIAARRARYNFGISYGKETALDLYVLPDSGRARALGRIPLSHPVLLHNFIVSENHLIFFVSPLRLVTWRMMLALKPFTDNFKWSPSDGSEIIIVPIEHPKEPVRFRTGPFCQFHFAGAFEEGRDIVVDYVR